MASNIFYFHPYLEKIPILTNIFQLGWNHQLDNHLLIKALFPEGGWHWGIALRFPWDKHLASRPLVLPTLESETLPVARSNCWFEAGLANDTLGFDMLFDIDLVVLSILFYLVLLGIWQFDGYVCQISWHHMTPPSWVQNMKSVWKCFQAETPTCWIFTGPKHHRPDTCRHVLFWLHVFMSSMTFLGSGRSMCKCWCPYGAHLMTKHWSNSDRQITPFALKNEEMDSWIFFCCQD